MQNALSGLHNFNAASKFQMRRTIGYVAATQLELEPPDDDVNELDDDRSNIHRNGNTLL